MAEVRQEVDGSSVLDDVIAPVSAVLEQFAIDGGPCVHYCEGALRRALNRLLDLRKSVRRA